MFVSIYLASAVLVTLATAQATFPASSKRGLVFVPNAAWPQDDKYWASSSSDITWYYNYMWQPSAAFAGVPQSKLEFVPMVWGAQAPFETQFLNNITALIKGGRNITHALAFNEPDGPWSQGGSNMSVKAAVEGWMREIVPLQQMGVKVGIPAVTQRGLDWLADFVAHCSNCTLDFIPVHWYGNYSGLLEHVGKFRKAYPTSKLWVTEYAYDHVSLHESELFFNMSANFFDTTDYIERYSYFGAFRSNISNVGPNAAMLTADGKLTNIGSWYLGGVATNNIPSSASLSMRSGYAWTAVLSMIVVALA